MTPKYLKWMRVRVSKLKYYSLKRNETEGFRSYLSNNNNNSINIIEYDDEAIIKFYDPSLFQEFMHLFQCFEDKGIISQCP